MLYDHTQAHFDKANIELGAPLTASEFTPDIVGKQVLVVGNSGIDYLNPNEQAQVIGNVERVSNRSVVLSGPFQSFRPNGTVYIGRPEQYVTLYDVAQVYPVREKGPGDAKLHQLAAPEAGGLFGALSTPRAPLSATAQQHGTPILVSSPSPVCYLDILSVPDHNLGITEGRGQLSLDSLVSGFFFTVIPPAFISNVDWETTRPVVPEGAVIVSSSGTFATFEDFVRAILESLGESIVDPAFAGHMIYQDVNVTMPQAPAGAPEQQAPDPDSNAYKMRRSWTLVKPESALLPGQVIRARLS